MPSSYQRMYTHGCVSLVFVAGVIGFCVFIMFVKLLLKENNKF